jgi:NDP-sugar pyrophosphorylase family protein
MGCRNIQKYFPENVIVLSGDLYSDMDLLQKLVDNPGKYKKKININTIKDKISLLKNIKTLF